MDLTPYKEQLAKGETVDFFVSKRVLKISFFGILLALIIGGIILITGRNILGLCVWIFVFLYMSRFVWAFGKALSSRSLPTLALSLSTEMLTVYDLSISALQGKDMPCVSIPWVDIVHLDIVNGAKGRQNIVLQCTPSVIENISQHTKQVSGKFLRTYDIAGNAIVLNMHSWIDMPIRELEALLKDVHQSATQIQQ